MVSSFFDKSMLLFCSIYIFVLLNSIILVLYLYILYTTEILSWLAGIYYIAPYFQLAIRIQSNLNLTVA